LLHPRSREEADLPSYRPLLDTRPFFIETRFRSGGGSRAAQPSSSEALRRQGWLTRWQGVRGPTRVTAPQGKGFTGKQGTELAEVIINKIKQAVNAIKFS
jgi:hypothetical protein